MARLVPSGSGRAGPAARMTGGCEGGFVWSHAPWAHLPHTPVLRDRRWPAQVPGPCREPAWTKDAVAVNTEHRWSLLAGLWSPCWTELRRRHGLSSTVRSNGRGLRQEGWAPPQVESERTHCQAERAARGGWGSRGRGPVLPARPHSLDRGCWCEAGGASGGTHSPGAAGGAAPGCQALSWEGEAVTAQGFSGPGQDFVMGNTGLPRSCPQEPCCPRPLSRTQAACVTMRSAQGSVAVSGPALAFSPPVPTERPLRARPAAAASWAPAPQAGSPAAAVCIPSWPASGGSGGSSWPAWGRSGAVPLRWRLGWASVRTAQRQALGDG